MDRICRHQVSTIQLLQFGAVSNLIFNFVVLENICKGDSKIFTGMGASHLHDVKKEADRNAILLEMYGNRYIGLVVGRSPSIRRKIQCARVFLYRMFQFYLGQPQMILTLSISEIFFRVALKTWFTSRVTVRQDGM